MTYNTENRLRIERLFKSVGARSLTADEITHLLSPDGSGRSSFYRIISKMVDEGKLRRIADEKTRRTTYQYLGDEHCAEHLHLKCNGCGRLIHLDHDVSEKLVTSLRSIGGFALDARSMLFGRCEKCIGEV